MAPEPKNDTGDMSQLFWSNSTELPKWRNETYPHTAGITDTFSKDDYNYIVIFSITLLISLFGMVGNGIVIWLLGFRMKRNPYRVYILNLAIADFLYLLRNVVYTSIALSEYYISEYSEYSEYFFLFLNAIHEISYPVGLTLLMAISAERCVSVLWPLWYKCHRPAHLSTIVCALIWGLFLIYFLTKILCFFLMSISCEFIPFFLSQAISLLTLPVLFVSSLILFIWGRCCSQRRQPSKLYWTILLNVVAVLLLNVPKGIYIVISWPYIFLDIPWYILLLLSAVNSTVNPVIYFFVGRHGMQRGRKSLREVLQSALTDGEERTEQRRGITDPRENRTTPEHLGGGALPSPQV